jgi:hypothetical protein
MDELKKWQEKDQNTPPYLPKMTEKENQLNYVALANCQKVGTMLEKMIYMHQSTIAHTYTQLLKI